MTLDVDSVISGRTPLNSLEADELALLLAELNDAYRAGRPLVSDHDYDHVYRAELLRRQPDHPFLNSVEPEPDAAFRGARVRHASPMLSTDKAYDQDEVDAFCRRVAAAAAAIGIQPEGVTVSITAKLDGLAGFDDGRVLATRGDGLKGVDVTNAFDRGVVPVGGRGLGAGELVVDLGFFERELQDQYAIKSPRNFMVGLIGADQLRAYHEIALRAGACRFVPYSTLPSATVTLDDLRVRHAELAEQVKRAVPYLTDGAVVCVCDARIRQAMGAASSFHRWMLALKAVGEAKSTTVRSVTLQCGRLGRITPVLELEPIRLSGAEIRRVTAHTGRNLERLGLGPGAQVEIVRSGEVIPFINKVLRQSTETVDLSCCPSCNGPTAWDGEYLTCPNTSSCHAQASRALEHFFSTLNNNDGFGPTTCEILVASGVSKPLDVYRMSAADFQRIGFGQGQSAILVRELARSRTEPVRENLFLAAFGIPNLGRGDARRLLREVPLEQLPELTVERLLEIEGFGAGTSAAIVSNLRSRWPEIEAILALGFNLESVTEQAAATGSPIAGLKLVFTGTMSSSREDMEREASRLGAIVQSSVSKTTDYLVCGAKVGATKTNKAAALGVKVITEAQYEDLRRGFGQRASSAPSF